MNKTTTAELDESSKKPSASVKRTPNKAPPTHKPLAVDAVGLARLLSVSRRSVITYDAAGLIPQPFRLGGRTLWSVSEIKRWLNQGSPSRSVWESIKAAAKSSAKN